MKAIYRITSLLLLSTCTKVMAVENYPDSHNHRLTKTHNHEAHVKSGSRRNFQTYSCDLISYSNQCREYDILTSSRATVQELKDGCESMTGQFRQRLCPTKSMMASCEDIVRNYHKPDVIYNNLYYTGKPSFWTQEVIERVCGDLGGELAE